MIEFTKTELSEFLDVLLNCEDEGILAKYTNTSVFSIDSYINDKF